ncbi:MAG: organic solvent ABC transporter substrate-binding protein [Bacteroidetes bacterium B1(2017)]|nr:MAG: organic solvent ABC transporter substrate-binding protein [Bacteroidetes bacterium B1(2017)]
MEKEISCKIKLAVFVLLGLAILLLGVYFIGQSKKLFSTTFSLNTQFKDVNGLQVGNNVRFAGINVGTVDAITIQADTSVLVNLVVDEKTREFIKTDAKAIIGSDGLMGNKILIISPGSKNKSAVLDNASIGTQVPVDFDEVLHKLKSTVDNAELISKDLAAIFGNLRNGKGAIGKLFMDTVFALNLDKSIVNIKQGTKGFKQNMDAAQNSILLKGFFNKKDKSKNDSPKK